MVSFARLSISSTSFGVNSLPVPDCPGDQDGDPVSCFFNFSRER